MLTGLRSPHDWEFQQRRPETRRSHGADKIKKCAQWDNTRYTATNILRFPKIWLSELGRHHITLKTWLDKTGSRKGTGSWKLKVILFMMRCKSWKFHEIDSGQHQPCLARTVRTNIQIQDSRVSCLLSHWTWGISGSLTIIQTNEWRNSILDQYFVFLIKWQWLWSAVNGHKEKRKKWCASISVFWL